MSSKQKGKKFGPLWIVVTIITLTWLLFCFSGSPYFISLLYGPLELRICRRQMSEAHRLLIQYYQHSNDNVIRTGDWCDTLRNTEGFNPKELGCRRAKNYRDIESSYSINSAIDNKSIEELPKDTVFMFDSKLGWNQVGGSDSVVYEYHRDGFKKVAIAILIDGTIVQGDPKRIMQLCWDPQVKLSKPGM